MSDSDASTVDPEDIEETKAALSDSDASTVDPENLEDTEPLDSSELRHLNNSPDLFADYPFSDVPKKKLKANKAGERDLLKPGDTKHEKLVKRRSKVHEVSDSGSDSDEREVTTKKSSDVKEKPREIKKDILKDKPYKKDHSKPFDSYSCTKVSSKEEVDKQKFISDFLNMSDDDMNDSFQTNANKSMKEEKSKTKLDKGKRVKDESVQERKSSLNKMTTFNQTETDTSKLKQRKLEAFEKTGSRDSVSVSLKRKSISQSPQVLKKSDTKILDTDKSTNSNGRVKPPCKYGSKCYRKNPSHRQEFSHPGIKI